MSRDGDLLRRERPVVRPMRGGKRPPTARGRTVAGANPVAKLAVAMVIPVFLILTVDPVTAGTALLLELLALPWCGVGPRALLRNGWIVLLSAIPAGLLTVLFAADSGHLIADLGPVTISTGSLLSGAAITLRILAIGLPGVVLIATTDPTDLADALAQVLHLPHRFVLSALAAFRLYGVLAQEWQALTMARRARGFDTGFGRAEGYGLGAFEAAERSGVRPAGAGDPPGHGAGGGDGGPRVRVERHRTWARPSRFRGSDLLIAFGGLLVAALATAVGVLTGSWNLVLA